MRGARVKALRREFVAWQRVRAVRAFVRGREVPVKHFRPVKRAWRRRRAG